jgi:4-hydroxy-3-methylbut-2-enyl diphosphate reductase
MKKVAVVAQSTQNLEKVLNIVAQVRLYVTQVRFFNTICKPTMTKQQEIKTMPLKNDLMVIIGSKSSANTKRLFEISKSLNKNSYWIQSKAELVPGWFKGIKRVGITSGSSTPDSTTEEVIHAIKKMA